MVSFLWIGNGKEENGSTRSKQKHVLILGGTGRVGSSTAASLLRSDPGLRITLAGRSRKTYEAAMKRRPELACCEVLPLLQHRGQSLHRAERHIGSPLLWYGRWWQHQWSRPITTAMDMD